MLTWQQQEAREKQEGLEKLFRYLEAPPEAEGKQEQQQQQQEEEEKEERKGDEQGQEQKQQQSGALGRMEAQQQQQQQPKEKHLGSEGVASVASSSSTRVAAISSSSSSSSGRGWGCLDDAAEQLVLGAPGCLAWLVGAAEQQQEQQQGRQKKQMQGDGSNKEDHQQQQQGGEEKQGDMSLEQLQKLGNGLDKLQEKIADIQQQQQQQGRQKRGRAVAQQQHQQQQRSPAIEAAWRMLLNIGMVELLEAEPVSFSQGFSSELVYSSIIRAWDTVTAAREHWKADRQQEGSSSSQRNAGGSSSSSSRRHGSGSTRSAAAHGNNGSAAAGGGGGGGGGGDGGFALLGLGGGGGAEDEGEPVLDRGLYEWEVDQLHEELAGLGAGTFRRLSELAALVGMALDEFGGGVLVGQEEEGAEISRLVLAGMMRCVIIMRGIVEQGEAGRLPRQGSSGGGGGGRRGGGGGGRGARAAAGAGAGAGAAAAAAGGGGRDEDMDDDGDPTGMTFLMNAMMGTAVGTGVVRPVPGASSASTPPAAAAAAGGGSGGGGSGSGGGSHAAAAPGAAGGGSGGAAGGAAPHPLAAGFSMAVAKPLDIVKRLRRMGEPQPSSSSSSRGGRHSNEAANSSSSSSHVSYSSGSSSTTAEYCCYKSVLGRGEVSSAMLLLGHFFAEHVEVEHIPDVNPQICQGYRGYWGPSLMRGFRSWAPGLGVHWRTLAVLNDLVVGLVAHIVGVVGEGFYDAAQLQVEITGETTMAALKVSWGVRWCHELL